MAMSGKACNWLVACGLFAITISICNLAQADIFVDNYSAATNDRFTNSGSFLAANYNLSGVGRTRGGKWATLIAPNVAISARHYHPGAEDIYFYPGNDPTATPVKRRVTAGQSVGDSDLWIMTLESDVPSSIEYFEFAHEDLDGRAGFIDDPGTFFHERDVLMVGRGREFSDNTLDQAFGTNRISGYVEDFDFQGRTNADSLIMFYEKGDTPYESLVVGGDSGAPLFTVDDNGNLMLLGTNWFRGTLDEEGVKTTLSGVAYMGNLKSEINPFIARSITAQAVPEPSSLLFLIGFAMTWLANRRRSLV